MNEWQRTLKRLLFAFLIMATMTSHWILGAETPMQRAEQAFVEARAQFQAEPSSVEVAWKFGRACFDWGEFSQNDKQREEIANQGIDVCRRVTHIEPKSVEGHYYLAMNLGQLARTKFFGALKLVAEMEAEFKIASHLDEMFDFAGPDRNLGMLYFQAPSWPTSIGNRNKARQHLERAVKLRPNYPDNNLNLLEAYLKWGDTSGAQREYESLKELWPAAKKEFSGAQWASDWADWELRWQKLQTRFSGSTKISDASHGKN